MGLKSALSKVFAKVVARSVYQWAAKPKETQERVFQSLLLSARNTAFGQDHRFKNIRTYADFKASVPIGDYETLKPYIERIKQGEQNVLWPGRPLYFAKTSGTTSGVKYIPLTKASIPYHISGARNALLLYIAQTGNAEFVNHQMIFLSGSPVLEDTNGIPTGRLSGIVNHYVPKYLRSNQLPSYTTNCIEDWEHKVDAIVGETINKSMGLISGIPPWVQMYFDKLSAKSGKTICELFPHFSLFVYGGVNYEPYRAKMEQSIGRKMDSIELYPASEGFIAYQDSQTEEGLLLLLNAGIFYEFIPAAEFYNDNPTRISIADVELGVNYVLILNTNAGLWGYNLGDTVKFVSHRPYRIVVTGRIKHYLSAFGEHVIGEEVETAILNTCKQHPAEIVEFTVAPQVNPGEDLPYHEWYIEFAQAPSDLGAFRSALDAEMQQQNTYYADLITGTILQPLKIKQVQPGGFIQYMKSQGKLGGQNKVPRLSNDRAIAEALEAWCS